MNESTIKEAICLVDDEPQVLRALARELGDYARERDLAIYTYTSPQVCLEALEKDSAQVSVIISDLRMPRMRGSEFLGQVHEKYPDIELLLLTAYNDIEDIQKAISAAIRALLIKPWHPEIVIAEIEKAREIYHMRRKNRRQQQKLEYHLKMARDFQETLMGTHLPQIPGIRMAKSYLPVENIGIGGDYYDIVQTGEKQFQILIGDVAGHGIRAAFIAAILKVLTLSGSYAPNKSSPAATLNTVNRKLCRLFCNNKDILVTLLCFSLDLENREVTVANAGHIPLHIVRGNKNIIVKTKGPALGFQENIGYQETIHQINAGDCIVAFTDGLVEADQEGISLSEADISRILAENRGSEDFNRTVIQAVKQARDISLFSDDVTLLSLEI